MKKAILFVLFALFSTTMMAQAIVAPESCDVDTVDLADFPDDENMNGGAFDTDSLVLKLNAEADSMLRAIFGNDLELDLSSPDWQASLVRQCENRTNLKAEALIQLMMIKHDSSRGNDTIGEGAESADAETRIDMYGDILKAYLEVGLYKDMGGSSDEVLRDVGQVVYVLYHQMMEVMPEYLQENPERVCKEVDEVGEYLKRLDYIGDIYKDGSEFLPREEQAAKVERITNETLVTLKDIIYKTSEEMTWLWEYLTDVAKNAKKVNLKKYMSKSLLKKMKKAEILDIIAFDSPFDANYLKGDGVLLEGGGGKYYIMMNPNNTKEFDVDALKNAKSYFVTLTKENGQYIISELEENKVEGLDFELPEPAGSTEEE